MNCKACNRARFALCALPGCFTKWWNRVVERMDTNPKTTISNGTKKWQKRCRQSAQRRLNTHQPHTAAECWGGRCDWRLSNQILWGVSRQELNWITRRTC